MKNQFLELFKKTKNQSRKFIKYFSVYEEIFKDFREKDIIFVEIGIYNGGSLEIWKKYFSTRSRIIGVDLNPECKKFETEGIEVFIGNQSDPEFWKYFFLKVGKVDIILDDGGHTNLDQIITAASVVPNINDGGILLTEDTHTSYMQPYNSEMKKSFINFSKKIIDDINLKFSKTFKQYEFSLSNYVYSIIFFESIVVYKIDRTKTEFNKLLISDGKSHNIQDLTWEGNEINIKKIKYFLSLFSSFIRLKKLTNFFKRKINSKILEKYFK